MIIYLRSVSLLQKLSFSHLCALRNLVALQVLPVVAGPHPGRAGLRPRAAAPAAVDRSFSDHVYLPSPPNGRGGHRVFLTRLSDHG